jgi:AcrR family transcriptional regulator
VTAGVTEKATVDRKEHIIRAAAALFAEHGYHGSGIDQLCRDVGLGRGALYYHISSKEQVLFEICRRNVAELVQIADRLGAEDIRPLQRMKLMLRALLANIAANQQEWQIFFHDYGALTGTRSETVLRLRDRFEALIQAMVDDCVQAGEFRPVAPIVTKGLLGFYNYSYLWLRPDGPQTPEQVAEIFFEVLVDGLRPRSDA